MISLLHSDRITAKPCKIATKYRIEAVENNKKANNSEFGQLLQKLPEVLSSFDHNLISSHIQEIGRQIKNYSNENRYDSILAMDISLMIAMVTRNNYVNENFSFDYSQFSGIMSTRIFVDCLWTLTNVLVQRKDILLSVCPIEDICSFLLQNVEITERCVASTILSFFANVCSSEEDRNTFLSSLSIDQIFEFIQSYEEACTKETERLLMNIFRFNFNQFCDENTIE